MRPATRGSRARRSSGQGIFLFSNGRDVIKTHRLNRVISSYLFTDATDAIFLLFIRILIRYFSCSRMQQMQRGWFPQIGPFWPNF